MDSSPSVWSKPVSWQDCCTVLLWVTLHLSDPGLRKPLKGRIHFHQPQHHFLLCFQGISQIQKSAQVSGISASGSSRTTCCGLTWSDSRSSQREAKQFIWLVPKVCQYPRFVKQFLFVNIMQWIWFLHSVLDLGKLNS